MVNALLIVDLQKDFCEGGSLPVKGGAEIAKRIDEFLCASRPFYDYVVASLDWHVNPGSHFSETPDFIDSWPRHCVAFTEGARFHQNFTNKDLIDELFFKGEYEAAYSAFEGHANFNQDLDSWLEERQVTDLDICGLAFDHCVKASAISAVKLGYETTVISGLSEAVNQDLDYLFNVLDEFKRNGVNVV